MLLKPGTGNWEKDSGNEWSGCFFMKFQWNGRTKAKIKDFRLNMLNSARVPEFGSVLAGLQNAMSGRIRTQTVLLEDINFWQIKKCRFQVEANHQRIYANNSSDIYCQFNSPLSKRVETWADGGCAFNYGIVWGKDGARGFKTNARSPLVQSLNSPFRAPYRGWTPARGRPYMARGKESPGTGLGENEHLF